MIPRGMRLSDPGYWDGRQSLAAFAASCPWISLKMEWLSWHFLVPKAYISWSFLSKRSLLVCEVVTSVNHCACCCTREVGPCRFHYDLFEYAHTCPGISLRIHDQGGFRKLISVGFKLPFAFNRGCECAVRNDRLPVATRKVCWIVFAFWRS